MTTIQRLHVATRYSEAAIFNGVVYLAGQVPNDATQDIQGQTREVLAMIDDLLAQVGSDKNHLLTVTVYLRDLIVLICILMSHLCLHQHYAILTRAKALPLFVSVY